MDKRIINEQEYPILWSYLRRMFGSESTMQQNLAFISLEEARDFEDRLQKISYYELGISRRIEKFSQKFQDCIEMQPDNASMSLRVRKSEAAMVKDNKQLICYKDKDEKKKKEDDQGTWISTDFLLQSKNVGHQMVKEIDSLHLSLKELRIRAEKSLANGEGIFIRLDDLIFGMPIEVYINKEDIFEFCDLEAISLSCIQVYMWYLYKKLEENSALDRFRLVNPFDISYIPLTTEEQTHAQIYARSVALAENLYKVSSNQIVMAPCNVGFHWILTIIDLDKNTVSLYNPLIDHQIRDNWKEIVDMAISMFNENSGKRGNVKQPTWETIKGPSQPDFKQCGFFILRFMKDFIEEVIKRGFNISLHSYYGNRTYSRKDIDEVRVEWANVILSHI